jgi:hypothetical protein
MKWIVSVSFFYVLKQQVKNLFIARKIFRKQRNIISAAERVFHFIIKHSVIHLQQNIRYCIITSCCGKNDRGNCSVKFGKTLPPIPQDSLFCRIRHVTSFIHTSPSYEPDTAFEILAFLV